MNTNQEQLTTTERLSAVQADRFLDAASLVLGHTGAGLLPEEVKASVVAGGRGQTPVLQAELSVRDYDGSVSTLYNTGGPVGWASWLLEGARTPINSQRIIRTNENDESHVKRAGKPGDERGHYSTYNETAGDAEATFVQRATEFGALLVQRLRENGRDDLIEQIELAQKDLAARKHKAASKVAGRLVIQSDYALAA